MAKQRDRFGVCSLGMIIESVARIAVFFQKRVQPIAHGIVLFPHIARAVKRRFKPAHTVKIIGVLIYFTRKTIPRDPFLAAFGIDDISVELAKPR